MPSISLGPQGCSEVKLVSDDDVCWQQGHASYRARRPTRTQPSAMSAASSLDGTVVRRAGRARRASPDRSTGGINPRRARYDTAGGAARSRISCTTVHMISYLAMRMHAAAASGESRASAARACAWRRGRPPRLDRGHDRGARSEAASFSRRWPACCRCPGYCREAFIDAAPPSCPPSVDCGKSRIRWLRQARTHPLQAANLPPTVAQRHRRRRLRTSGRCSSRRRRGHSLCSSGSSMGAMVFWY